MDALLSVKQLHISKASRTEYRHYCRYRVSLNWLEHRINVYRAISKYICLSWVHLYFSSLYSKGRHPSSSLADHDANAMGTADLKHPHALDQPVEEGMGSTEVIHGGTANDRIDMLRLGKKQ
jgi:hypothetical protein